MKLLLATKNKAKINEYKEFFKEMPSLEVLTLNDLNISDDVEETGKTFLENALLKAKTYAEKSGVLTLSEDGGLEIEALGNEPGVYSRRWPGYEAPDEELIHLALKKMENISNRKAKLSVVAVLYDPKKNEHKDFSSEINGKITEDFDGRIKEGFPFRSIFYVPELQKLLIDFTKEDHEQINHRREIVDQIIKYLNLRENKVQYK